MRDSTRGFLRSDGEVWEELKCGSRSSFADNRTPYASLVFSASTGIVNGLSGHFPLLKFRSALDFFPPVSSLLILSLRISA